MIKKYTKTSFFIILLAGQFFTFNFVSAQSGYDFLTSWKADGFVPAWYEGKILPSRGSRVSISFELINNGKISDLSNTVVRWYINDNLVKNENDGLGIKKYLFTVTDYPGNNTEVRIALPDYKGQSLNKIIQIPVVNPEVVIESPAFSLNNISKTAIFKANPFFFNVKIINNLSFQWTANGQATGIYKGSNILDFNVDPKVGLNSQINLKVIAKNLLNEMEFANKEIQFKLK
ncbi:MAG: hypothetical protein NUV83_00540 [Candidatus Wolfebacteria bacterium]|nr:hypothetical protein [Candidatus Wolfebacteria bacterium]